MKSASLIVTVLVSCLVLLVTAEPLRVFDTLGTASAVAKSNNVFGWKVYKELKQTSGNILLSPFSLHSVLAMLHSGSGGETADELRNVLALPEDEDSLERGYYDLIKYIDGPHRNTTVRVANKLFTSGVIKDEYVNYVKRHFGSEAEHLNFLNPEAKQIINSWVEEKTNHRIKDLMGHLRSDTTIVLVNALYFKGIWKDGFETRKTSDGDFYRSKDVKRVVKMMSGKMTLPYIDNGDYQAIRMPYEGDFNLVVLLPRDIEGVSKLEDTLSSLDWDDLNQQLSSHPTRVLVTLPKFTIESKWDLVGPLSKLGIRSIFSRGVADFSRMSNSPGIEVDDVVQKTFIEVKEEGTEAAAATGISAHLPLAPDRTPVPEFKADHPFIFVLQHDTTNANLFIGRFSQPS